MDTPALPLGSYDAGKRYLAAVDALGLRPAAFFWAFDQVTNGFVLVLITEEFDAVGPLALSTMLMKAHNARATPPAIDPFILRFHSPRHQLVRAMDKSIPPLMSSGASIVVSPRAMIDIDGLSIDRSWVYRFDTPLSRSSKPAALVARWRRFERNVDKAAA